MTKDEKIALYEDMLGITEDLRRYEALRDAYGLSPGSTWLMSRLIAAKGRWLPKGTLLDAIPAMDPAKERGESNVKVRIAEITKRLGRGMIDNDRVLGYRLSKVGRDYIDSTLKVHSIKWYTGEVHITSSGPLPVQLGEATVRHPLNDPDTLPIDRMRVHGRWRAGGG